MPEFTVSWDCQVDAETYVEAARKAKAMQRDPGTTADVYLVQHPLPGSKPRVIDLSVEDGRLPESERAHSA